jgi:hypothetical protein
MLRCLEEKAISSFWYIWCKLQQYAWKTFHRDKEMVPEEEKLLWIMVLHDEMLQRI